MDQAHPSCSAATTVTVETETCRLLFLSATEESFERVLTLCRFVAMLLASQPLEHIVDYLRFSCHVAIIATPAF